MQRAVRFTSGEWMLDWPRRRANGGGLILGRALWATTIVYLLLLIAHESIGPPHTTAISLAGVRRAVLESASWYALVFGGVFATLTTRYASQWRYLAELYNQIKAAEVGAPETTESRSRLIEWKAGFVEDAQVLHLVTKPIFASVIAAWK